MEEKIDKAIEELLDKIRPTTKFDEALKYTQAALNLGHLKQLIAALQRASPKKT